MNAFQFDKIASAVAPEAAKLSDSMSGNVRICPEMPGQNTRNGGTKPGRTKDEGSPSAQLRTGGQKDEGKEEKFEAHPKSLPPRQMTAVRLLLRGKSAAAVGRVLEVNERTVRRWMDDPKFMAEVNALASPKKSSSVPPMLVPGSMPSARR